MKIRKAKRGDLKEVAEIFRIESAKEPYNTKFTPTAALKDISDCFKEDLHVAIDAEKIVGFIASHIIRSTKKKAYIDEIWVRYTYQGKGIGNMLMKFIEDYYKKKGIEGILLVTRKKAGAYNFYKKLKYNEPEVMVFMEKKL